MFLTALLALNFYEPGEIQENFSSLMQISFEIAMIAGTVFLIIIILYQHKSVEKMLQIYKQINEIDKQVNIFDLKI